MSELNIFTDGSKLDNRVGAGYVFYKVRSQIREEQFNLPEQCSVFQAEVLAIKKAATDLVAMGGYRFVRFFVDSQAALLAINSKQISSKLVEEAVLALNKASENRTIVLNWTKAHVGVEGNEKADRLAKSGALGCNRVEVGLPPQELKNRISEYFYSQWKREFQDYGGARMGKCF